MKLQIQLILLALTLATIASQESHIYCGRRLAIMIANICSDEEAIEKRSSALQNQFALEPRWPWIAPQKAMRMERGKRQVATECCDKPCTLDEMMAYCP